MLLGALAASLLGNMLTGKGINRVGEGIIRIQKIFSQGSPIKKFVIPPHSLTNLEIQKYYLNETRFDGVCSRVNLHDEIRDGAFIINLDEYSDIGDHWIAIYSNNKVICFDSFYCRKYSKTN